MSPGDATDRALAALLAHDVGKYIARIAHNVSHDAPFPAALVPLLVKDLYRLPGGRSAGQRLAEPTAAHPALDAARAGVAEIDALEAEVRAGDLDACRRAARLALEVENSLREYMEALA